MKSCILWSFILVFLMSPSAALAADNAVEKTVCKLAVGYENVDDIKADLLIAAKREVINELFGELIVASTAVENFVVTSDQIRASSIGFVRVDGSADFRNGESFAEVCVEINAYVTEDDKEKFEPIKLEKKYCDADDDLTTTQLISYVKEEAIIVRLVEYEPKLKGADHESLLQLVQNVVYRGNAFIPDTQTYCATFEGEVVPVEIMAFLETDGFISKTITDNSYNDEFDGLSLNQNWYWLREDPSRWSLETIRGQLHITATGGTISGASCNSTKNILLQLAPAGDFEIESKLLIHPTQPYQQGGLIVYSDQDNWVRLVVVWHDYFLNSGNPSGEGLVFAAEQNGANVDGLPSSLIYQKISDDGVFLKIAKHGNQYEGFYSFDGEIYTRFSSISIPSIANPQIGIYTSATDGMGCSTGTDTPVRFEFFRVNAEAEQANNPQSAANMAGVGCELEGSVSSQLGETKVSFSITNLSNSPIELFWLDYTGQRKSYGLIASGQTKTQSSYTTHPWVIARESDKVCLQLVENVVAAPNITIRD